MAAARFEELKKVFITFDNKPNTLWLSRVPDKAEHVLTITPRYVDEAKGKVIMDGKKDVDGRFITSWSKSEINIGFEVTNMSKSTVVVRMIHKDSEVANYVFKSGERYFFDNRNALDKRMFSLKKKLDQAAPGGMAGAPIERKDAAPEENNFYRFMVFHVKADPWPARLVAHVDSHIMIPYEPPVAQSHKSFALLPIGLPAYPAEHSVHRSAAESRLMTLSAEAPRMSAAPEISYSLAPVARGMPALPYLPSRSLPSLPSLPSPASARPSLPSPTPALPALPSPAPAHEYVAEQQLGDRNNERLGDIEMVTDDEHPNEVAFVTVLTE